MHWLPRMRCKLTLLFVVFFCQYHVNRTYVILRQTDSCITTHRHRNQFSEFHSESSVKEYDFHPKEENLTFELSFCTLSRSATIAKFQDTALGKTLFIQIVDGSIILSVEEFQNWQPGCYWNVQGKSVSDGTHHTIKIRISPGLLDAQLYHMSRPLGGEKSNFSHCVTNGTLGEPRHIEIGGEIVERYNDSKVQVLYGFTGCMSNIRLNGRPIEQEAEQDTSVDSDDGCMEFQESCTDICPPTFEFKDGYCECSQGNHVDKTGACSPSCDCTECQNGRTCKLSDAGPECVCPEGYSGSFCEDILNPCTCYNGSCERIAGSVLFRCKCHRGYTGIFCNVTDVCFPNPCSNSGACIRNSTNHDDFTCNCLSGFFGRLCEKEESSSSAVPLYVKVLITTLGCAFLIILFVIIKALFLERSRAPSIKEVDDPSGTPVSQREHSSLDEQHSENASLNSTSEHDNSTSEQDERSSQQSRNTSDQDNNVISEISCEKEQGSQDNATFTDSGNDSGGDCSSICSKGERGESFHPDSDVKSIKSGMIGEDENTESSSSLDNAAEDVVSTASNGSCEERLLENPSVLKDDAISISSDMRSASEENEHDLDNSAKLVNDCAEVVNDGVELLNDIKDEKTESSLSLDNPAEDVVSVASNGSCGKRLLENPSDLKDDAVSISSDMRSASEENVHDLDNNSKLVNDSAALLNDNDERSEEPEGNEITHLQIENPNTDEDSSQSQETCV